MTIIVQKYGESSLNGVTRIRQVAAPISETNLQSHKVVAVVSAMGNSTDNLIKLAQQLTISPDDRELDILMSPGELVSATLMTMALKDMGCRTISPSGLQAAIQTDNQYRRARIINIESKRIREEFARGNVVIVAGFQGASLGMEITTSEIRITCVIPEMQVPIVVQSLHKSFGLDNII